MLDFLIAPGTAGVIRFTVYLGELKLGGGGKYTISEFIQ